MDQLKDLADNRLISGCIYCGGREETRDHVPSRVFLDQPYPSNLPVLPACFACNNSISLDEEYVACLIESVIVGSTDPKRIRRPRVAQLLVRSPALRSRIERARRTSGERTEFQIEAERVRNVIVKLARGHAAYELSLPCRHQPQFVGWQPVELMNEENRLAFESPHFSEMFPEVGSRALQRMVVAQIKLASPDGNISQFGFLMNDWIEVQHDRYEYLAVQNGDTVVIRMLIAGYLAAEVTWLS